MAVRKTRKKTNWLQRVCNFPLVNMPTCKLANITVFIAEPENFSILDQKPTTNTTSALLSEGAIFSAWIHLQSTLLVRKNEDYFVYLYF